MPGFEVRFHASILPRIRLQDGSSDPPLFGSEGRLFLESCAPDSSLAPPLSLRRSRGKADPLDGDRRGAPRHGFLSVSLSVKGSEVFVRESAELLGKEGVKRTEEAALERKEEDGVVVVLEEEKKNGIKNKSGRVHGAGTGAMNTTKHLWAGAVAAMVSRTFVAPLERLKLEYILRGEQSNLFVLIHKIATTQGLKGFWKGNFVNILRTAPFKAVNFYAYDTYRKQLLRLSGNEETTNFERFIAGAAAGITATILCIPMDTIRTKMVAPGGEALGGVIGVFRHMIQTEGFFSLYKGLVPSLVSMAPSGAVFYGVYDILKSAYLHSPEGRKRTALMKQQEGEEMNAFDQLELGPVRTLLYGAIAGACAEAATYPFEVVRRQLQIQVQANKMNAFATFMKIVEQGGVPALYAGLVPSLLQVLPSSSISYFVYEFMKIVLKTIETGRKIGSTFSNCSDRIKSESYQQRPWSEESEADGVGNQTGLPPCIKQ
ncbi:putative mitochondrial adenine nucleotide transporter BTL3 [Canna indica]|uniref:Mitochondrial adenine nucleotide transporter BTL3 n=1 Tax=Canna indica TaxID=4628 RepID=A0AAQ3QKI3_9LILI|nr:putative mitochondrial adenine nucleotide transporter BTL3 [Canna indica]